MKLGKTQRFNFFLKGHKDFQETLKNLKRVYILNYKKNVLPYNKGDLFGRACFLKCTIEV
jgi:hypothetical protein